VIAAWLKGTLQAAGRGGFFRRGSGQEAPPQKKKKKNKRAWRWEETQRMEKKEFYIAARTEGKVSV